ncbi:MAG: hypothetical protein COA49_04165 [Bacteroidetes bacterium]|nr:MAG: hypothetical protein COA49_04165 [Bacteroidota bacterium]
MKNLFEALLESIVPRTCMSCGREVRYEGHIAGACTICVTDWGVFEFGDISKTLFKERFFVTWCALGFRLGNGTSRAIIHKCKYGGEPGLVKELGRWMATRWPAPPIDVVLVPIPVHWKRRLQRGYNQAEKLAMGMSEVWSVEVDYSRLVRLKHGDSLTGSTREGREEALRETYGVANIDILDNRPVVLVDDVLTTGATLRACREVFEIHGREVIGAAVLALA